MIEVGVVEERREREMEESNRNSAMSSTLESTLVFYRPSTCESLETTPESNWLRNQRIRNPQS